MLFHIVSVPWTDAEVVVRGCGTLGEELVSHLLFAAVVFLAAPVTEAVTAFRSFRRLLRRQALLEGVD